ncbi:MAG: hypothetical protein WC071_12035 [Victivallaceae bacterium]
MKNEVAERMSDSVQSDDTSSGLCVKISDTEIYDDSEEIECLNCGEIIPSGRDTCQKCGWSYNE